MFYKIYLYAFIVCELVLYSMGLDNNAFMLRLSLIFFVLLLLLYLKNEKSLNAQVFSNWIRPSYIVIIGLIIVNFQTITNVLAGVAPLSEYLRTYAYDNYMGKVLHLGLLSTSVFLLGNSSCHKSFAIELSKKSQPDYSYQLKIWNILSLVFFCLFIYTIDLVSFVTGTYYGDTKGSENMGVESSSYFEVLYSCSIIIILSLYTYIRRRDESIGLFSFLNGLPKMFLITTIVYIWLRMLSGDRGPVIYTIMSYLYAYILVSHKKIRFLYVVIGISLSAVLITLLGFARGMDTSMTFSERMNAASSVSMQEYYVPSLVPATQELAGSVNCNFIAVRDIDTYVTDYKYGAYHLFELLGVVPGSSSLLSRLFDIRLADYQSSYYLTTSFFGEDFAYSLGTTAVAEPFLDFGVLGCIIIFYVFGVFFKKLDYSITCISDSNVSRRIIILKMSAWALYIARASFFQIFTSGLYILLIYSVVSLILKKLRLA